MPSSAPLTYLFEADFSDGTTYKQGLDDKPLEGSGSSFSDVMKRIDDVIVFHLARISDGQRFTVDLRDGHFECNGVTFNVGQPLPKLPDKFQLIYFRICGVQSNYPVKIVADPSSSTGTRPVVGESTSQNHHVKYHKLGWICEINGKEYQQIILVA